MGTKRNWHQTHQDWRDSGLPVKAFCQARKISISGFYASRKRYRLIADAAGAPKLEKSPAGFIKATVRPPPPVVGIVTIELPNKVKITTDKLSCELVTMLSAIGGG